MECEAIDLGLISYQDGYRLQKELHKKRRLGQIPDTLLVLEHAAVITLGRNTHPENILVSSEYLKEKSIETFEIDRGGDVTIHLPGQIVAYPIFDLKNFSRDIHLFIFNLEDVIINFLSKYKIKGQRLERLRGVWAGDGKIGFIGVGISNWISYHGLCINISCDLNLFSLILPCGIKEAEVTSLEKILKNEVSFPQIKASLFSSFRDVFNLNYIHEFMPNCA